ncbi:hypothetical protein SCALM49S_05316 [Streptomyces californicus]
MRAGWATNVPPYRWGCGGAWAGRAGQGRPAAPSAWIRVPALCPPALRFGPVVRLFLLGAGCTAFGSGEPGSVSPGSGSSRVSTAQGGQCRGEQFPRPNAAERRHQVAVRADQQHGVGGGPRVAPATSSSVAPGSAPTASVRRGMTPAVRQCRRSQTPVPGATRTTSTLPRPSRSRSRAVVPSGVVTVTSVTGAPGGVPTAVCASECGGARGEWEYEGRAQRSAAQMTVDYQRVVAACRARDQGPQPAPAAQYRQGLVGGAQPRGDRGPALRLVAVEQLLGRAVVPGVGELPGQVLASRTPSSRPWVPSAPSRCAASPARRRAACAAPGEPVVERVDAGVQQFVRRHSPHQPAKVSRTRLIRASGVTRSASAGSSQSSRHTPPGNGRAETSAPAFRQGGLPVQNGLARPREFGPEGGDGVPLHRRTAGEADVEQLADGGPGAVAADQIASAPPGAGPAPWCGP